MKTFEETFKNVIDMTNGTVMLNEKKFAEIQQDILNDCIRICKEGYDAYINLGSRTAAQACLDVASNIRDAYAEKNPS